MKTQGKYTLRRAADGVGHFARVEVVPKSEGTVEVRANADTSEIWLAAARRGVRDALGTVGERREWVLASFVGTVADTTEDDAWVAAAMAVLDALTVQATLTYEGAWVITLPSGVRLLSSGA